MRWWHDPVAHPCATTLWHEVVKISTPVGKIPRLYDDSLIYVRTEQRFFTEKMKFIPNNYFHVFNQGNNKQLVFLKEPYYDIFMSLYETHVMPHCVTVNYVLMPNHFHFLIYCDGRFDDWDRSGLTNLHPINEGFRRTLSHYARIVNSMEGRSGSIFRQNTKAKCLEDELRFGTVLRSKRNYLEECFYYIHRNPIKAGLVRDLAHWRHSAYRQYAGLQNGICDLERAKKDCGYDPATFKASCHALEVEQI